jgi:hypothetical protein
VTLACCIAVIGVCGLANGVAGEAEAPPAIVSRGKDPASQLINKWFKEGSAAGLEGVWYDNRDRKHSDLGIATYPQMQPVTYTEAELRARADWGGQRKLLPGKVVVGNSSTASGATSAGSHQRMFYVHPQGLPFLYRQYRSNALYVYPEHRDHDPGITGPDGYGDLYPANSPYLISSQGSSGSDRVFMHAVIKTIAAFPPKTREALVDKGLLMPTVQAIFRRTYKACKEPNDYFTGKAHPSAFRGDLIDEAAMVTLAQGMAAEAIPPIVQLRVSKEPAVTPGRDFFETPGVTSERIADSPCAIARVFRGPEQQRTLEVNAADSIDPVDRVLTFRWVLLRGDPSLITIRSGGERSERATITVTYHPRRPIAPGSPMWSNRVDIGVFAEAEGSLVSAPAFLSFANLPNEHRTYAKDGRVLEIFYGARSSSLGVPPPNSERWDGLLAEFETPAAERSPGTRLLAKAIGREQPDALTKAAAATKEAREKLAGTGEKLAAIEAKHQARIDRTNKIRVAAIKAHKQTPGDETKKALDKANTDHNAAKKAVRDGDAGAADLRNEMAELRGKVATAINGASIPAIVTEGLNTMRSDPRFFSANEDEIRSAAPNPACPKAAAALSAALRRLEFVGITESADPPAYERYHLEQRNLELLSRVLLPGFLERSPSLFHVDPRLSATKHWRDVYHYAEDGRISGWTRYQHGEYTEFTAAGELILERKTDGSPKRCSPVTYSINPKTKHLEAVTK